MIQKLTFFACFAMAISANMIVASAQTLSQRLKSEDMGTLASEARQYGSAVRGSILYTNQAMACTKCHLAGGQNLAGPDLTRLGEDVNDDHLIESLLEPSKKIREGFASTVVLTEDGNVAIGWVFKETDDELILRDASGSSELIKILKRDIEQQKPSTTSAMPDSLVDQLKDRREFLDLVRYVMQLVETGRNQQTRELVKTGQSIDPAMQGLVWLKEFNCAACHKDDLPSNSLTPKRAPILDWSSHRIDPRHIEQFITDPLKTKPGTTMPDLMSGYSVNQRQVAAKELTHYVVSLGDQSFDRQPIDAKAAARGGELFHSVGCVACHAPRNDSDQETVNEQSVPLGPISEKYSVETLADFLENPHQVRPSGRMPNMRLTHWESLDIASYLCEDFTDESDRTFRFDPDLVAKGKARFQQLNCMRCHADTSDAPSLKPFSQLRPNHGCLSKQTGDWPRFDFTAAQRDSIQASLSEPQGNLTDQQEISLTVTAFRCVNCHTRGELGGVSPQRNPHFQTTNPNLGPQGRIPPTLTNVGAKLNPKWMRQVLVSGRSIRPYLKTRMPQYGADNIAHLVDLFGNVDEVATIEHGTIDDAKTARKTGAEMVGTAGLNCIACHTFQLKKSANMPAVDLTEMAERLQKNWFYHYMLDPQSLSPNTVMPTFWPGGKSMRGDILAGDTNNQIEALWQYLLDGRQASTPRGLIREPIRLLATDEAVMLRRSYPEIGKRGIGVGYPGGVNIAFDAEQLRLATIWQGPFADPAGVWRSQGHGRVRPLGEKIIQLPKGPELDNPDTPWIVDEGRPPNRQFKGYSLDELQRPTFRYAFGGVHVEDYFVDTIDESTNQPMLRRILTFVSSGNEQKAFFRIVRAKGIERESEGVFVVDEKLKIRLDADLKVNLVRITDGYELRLPLTISANASQLTLEYIW